MPSLAKRKTRKEKVVVYRCPACARDHLGTPEFGCFCCASCLQAIVRPLIVTLTTAQNQPKIRAV